jgi:putative holliday junction resolvase
MTRILAVDPGSKRLGIALSDPTGTIASPHSVLLHHSRGQDAQRIAEIANQFEVGSIIIGQALTSDGTVGPSGRKSQRLADAIKEISDIQVILWDESGSTQIAQQAALEMGKQRKRRHGHHDMIAAVVILQDYLDNRNGLYGN